MHKQEAKWKVKLGMARGFCYLTAHTPVVYFLQQGPPPQPLKTVLPTGSTCGNSRENSSNSNYHTMLTGLLSRYKHPCEKSLY